MVYVVSVYTSPSDRLRHNCLPIDTSGLCIRFFHLAFIERVGNKYCWGINKLKPIFRVKCLPFELVSERRMQMRCHLLRAGMSKKQMCLFKLVTGPRLTWLRHFHHWWKYIFRSDSSHCQTTPWAPAILSCTPGLTGYPLDPTQLWQG